MKTKTPKPKTKSPKTKSPKTKSPKTKSPKTKSPKTKSPKTKSPKTKSPKTKSSKTKVSRKQKNKVSRKEETEPIRNTNTMIKQNFEGQQPIILYSKNKETGQETLLEAKKTEKDGMKSFYVKTESKIPPTIISDNYGKSMMSMSQKRQLVVQSFSSKK